MYVFYVSWILKKTHLVWSLHSHYTCVRWHVILMLIIYILLSFHYLLHDSNHIVSILKLCTPHANSYKHNSHSHGWGESVAVILWRHRKVQWTIPVLPPGLYTNFLDLFPLNCHLFSFCLLTRLKLLAWYLYPFWILVLPHKFNITIIVIVTFGLNPSKV